MKKLIAALLTALVMVGCAQKPVYHPTTVFNKPKTTSGRQCVQRCLQQKSRCNRRCGSDHQQCMMRQKKLAHERFVQYVNEMVQEDTPVKQKERDFIDYAACSSSCQCIKSYKNCYTLCGGAVTERKVCVSNCGK